jgi:hypothetical protein
MSKKRKWLRAELAGIFIKRHQNDKKKSQNGCVCGKKLSLIIFHEKRTTFGCGGLGLQQLST